MLFVGKVQKNFSPDLNHTHYLFDATDSGGGEGICRYIGALSLYRGVVAISRDETKKKIWKLLKTGLFLQHQTTIITI